MKTYLFLFQIFICLLVNSNIKAESFSIIVHKDNADSVNVKERFLLAEGSENWDSGAKVVPFMINFGTDLKKLLIVKSFLTKILDMSKSDYDNYWIDQKSAGRTDRPIDQNSFEDVLRSIKREKGGIGFVPTSLVNADVKEVQKFETP